MIPKKLACKNQNTIKKRILCNQIMILCHCFGNDKLFEHGYYAPRLFSPFCRHVKGTKIRCFIKSLPKPSNNLTNVTSIGINSIKSEGRKPLRMLYLHLL